MDKISEVSENPYQPPRDVAEADVDDEPIAEQPARDAQKLPALHADKAFWGMTGTQFFGAFNDNIFKQLLLLLAVRVAVTNGSGNQDLQWLISLLFAVPFILFSGLAGYLSERFSKRNVIVLSKFSEIVVMLLGMASFWAYGQIGMGALFFVLFLMAAQSAFFGPGKYGILPEMLRSGDLPRANGVILMTTFLAIIFGQSLAGFLKDQFEDQLWMAASVCVVVAVVGLGTSLLLRPTPPASPNLKFHVSSLTVPKDVRQLLWNDRPLFWAILVSCVFWLCGGIGLPAINALGIEQLLKDDPLDDTLTGMMAASVGVGTAIGCILAGLISGHRVNFRLVKFGNWGIVVCLTLLSIPGGANGQLLGFTGSLVVLTMLGVFTGFFVVPLNVFLQSRPPRGSRGRIMATMNLTNWIALALSALLYLTYDTLLDVLGWPPSGMFALVALLMLPVAVLYRPKDQELD